MHIVFRTKFNSLEYRICNFQDAQKLYKEWSNDDGTFNAGIAVIIESIGDILQEGNIFTN